MLLQAIEPELRFGLLVTQFSIIFQLVKSRVIDEVDAFSKMKLYRFCGSGQLGKCLNMSG